MRNETITISFHRTMWNQFLDACTFNAACRQVIETPEMEAVGIWLAENTAGTNYGADGVNRITMPLQLASYLLSTCSLFSLNKDTQNLAPWVTIGNSLHAALFSYCHTETINALTEKDYSDKGFPFYGEKKNYSDN